MPKKAKSRFNVATILIIMDINWHGKTISKHLNNETVISHRILKINCLRSELTIHKTSMRSLKYNLLGE
jgi:hypothetical protein